MKKEICEKTMDKFLELDKNQKIPFKITWHLLRCKECRTQVRLCTIAEKIASKPLNATLPLDNETLMSIMEKVDSKYGENKKIKKVSLVHWIVIGIFMLIALLFYGIQTVSLNSTFFVVPFYLCFAVIVTVYCALFIGSNLDFFVKKFNTLPKSMRKRGFIS